MHRGQVQHGVRPLRDELDDGRVVAVALLAVGTRAAVHRRRRDQRAAVVVVIVVVALVVRELVVRVR
eukprot:5315-Pelagococcus_subviridis.AAC.3